ncbi:MAG: response regulator, partial [Proteobacteria bacterium]|nr:response regulator [Pseudomonadota bacterium]
AKAISRGERKAGFDLSNAPFFEFDQVSRTFNDMVAKLSGAEQLEAHARALAEANERLQREFAERLRAERALKESEERFRSLCENSPDIIFTLETDGSFAYVSPAWAKVLGHRPEDITGRRWVDFIPEDEAVRFQGMFDRIIRDKETVTGLTGHLVHRDGTHRLFSLSGGPNLDAAGQVIGLVGLGRDVTERHALDVQLQHAHKMEAVGTLAGGVAHDFNNILHVVSGYVQLLLRRRDPGDPDYRPLQDMDDTLKRAGDLVNQLLTFSRKADSRPQVIDFNDMVRQVVRLLERTIPRMIRIEAHLASDLGRINIDPTQLERILMNLAGNARDAMPDGGRLILRTENVHLSGEGGEGTGLAPGRYVRLTVRDMGTGIDEEVLPQIFDPFFTTKEVGRGTGLGLATVYGIVKNHGGDIRVHSALGEGTTFELYFPALEAEPVPVAPVRVDQDVVRGGSETILLVDDEPGVVEIGRQILTEYGYSVLQAESGEKALELIAVGDERIDLVLLDLNMPGMGGQRCLQEIHRLAPELKVVIASGYGADGVGGDGLDLGKYDFIRKPFRLQQLLRKVRQVLDGRPAKAASST